VDIKIFSTNEEYKALESFLATRLYEFNAAATGVSDAQYLGLQIEGAGNEVVAGVAGHTWCNTCFLGYVWVSERERGKGYGKRLLEAAEQEARKRGCGNIVLSTHSFQAPRFYERMGFEKSAEVAGHPVGHSNIWFTKALVNGP